MVAPSNVLPQVSMQTRRGEPPPRRPQLELSARVDGRRGDWDVAFNDTKPSGGFRDQVKRRMKD